jgi:hypothetical protein
VTDFEELKRAFQASWAGMGDPWFGHEKTAAVGKQRRLAVVSVSARSESKIQVWRRPRRAGEVTCVGSRREASTAKD